MLLCNVARWPSLAVFLVAGLAAACFAFMTVNLFSQAMESVRFLKSYGIEAVRHGALLQVLQLCAWGALSLACWLTFKVCEGELISRYQAWSRQRNEARITEKAKT